MPGPATKKEIVGLAVKLEVLTKDQLRRFIFGIQKSQKDGVDTWGIDFKLLSRTTTTVEFVEMVALKVDLDLKKVAVEDVEATASKGLNKQQVEFVLGSVADDAERFKAKKLKEPRMKRTLGELFAARNG